MVSHEQPGNGMKPGSVKESVSGTAWSVNSGEMGLIAVNFQNQPGKSGTVSNGPAISCQGGNGSSSQEPMEIAMNWQEWQQTIWNSQGMAGRAGSSQEIS